MSIAPSTSAASEGTVSAIRKEVFPHGLTVVTEPMPVVRSVAIGVWLSTGSRNERREENGVTHFLEHMVFKGTANRSAEEIARAADSIGGHLDAFTAKECTSFSIKVLDEQLPRAMSILADLVQNPLFQPDDIDKECQVVQEEIKMVEDTPDDLVHEIFTQNYWGDHALGRPILGTRQTVESFDRSRLQDYFGRHYVPNRMLIAAAGNLEHDRVVELISKEFQKLEARAPIQEGPAPVPHPQVELRAKNDLEQVHLCVGVPGYPHGHEKRFAGYILNTVLGGGMSSRLFQNIREKRGLAYAVFSGLSSFRDAGCLSVYAGTGTENAREVVRLIVEEFRQLKAKPIDQEELQRAKDYLKSSMLLSLESTVSRMSNLARQEMYFGRHISLDEIAQRIDATTADDVLAVARELIRTEQVAVTVLGPLNGLKIDRASDLAC